MEATIACQRLGEERRSHSLRTFFYSFTRSGNRRRHVRREVCLDNSHYVDSHDAPWLFAMTIAIMGLSCTDAFFTLMLLQQGAQEINPIMNSLIEIDIQLFVIIKVLLTAACLIFILAHRNFWLVRGVIRTSHILPCLFIGYCALIAHELIMLNNSPAFY